MCTNVYERKGMAVCTRGCVFACVCEAWVRRISIHTPALMQTSALRKASAWMRELAQVLGALTGARGHVQAGFQLAQFQGFTPVSWVILQFHRPNCAYEIKLVMYFPCTRQWSTCRTNTSGLHCFGFNMGINTESGLRACSYGFDRRWAF